MPDTELPPIQPRAGISKLSVKGQEMNSSGFMCQVTSVTNAQLCHCSRKAVTDREKMNESAVSQYFIYRNGNLNCMSFSCVLEHYYSSGFFF